MSESFSGARVLVTGAGGFIGSWLTEALIDEGADVSTLIHDGPIGDAGISHVKDKVKYLYGDITKPETLKGCFKDQELVFHLAALTQVLHSFGRENKFMEVNEKGTFNVLEAARRSKSLEFLVFSSTDKVYGEPKKLPIDETHPLSPKSPYDASKLAGDRLVESYHKYYGMPTARTRWSNTIGGRDVNILRAVPDFVTSIMNGRPPTIRGDGRQVRDYIYVTDAVSGMLAVARARAKGEAFNLGTERPTSVLEMANLVIEKMGMSGKMEPAILGKNNPGEIDRQYLSTKKAREKLGWSPKVSLEDGVAMATKWYVEHPEWYNVMLRVKKYWDSR